MPEIRPEITAKIKEYLDLVEKRGIVVDAAYLFGSYAENTETEESDIDLAIVSAQFDGVRILDREKLLGLSRKVDVRISPLPMTKNAVKNSLFFNQEVLNKGIRIS